MQINTARNIVLAVMALWAAAAFAGPARISFVGCPANGQVGPLPPPTGKSRTVLLRSPVPGPIAYYEGAQGYGVYAPAGWHCRVSYGSAGAWLVVTPQHIPTGKTFSFDPPIVEMATIDGGTSGRFLVAQIGYMLFPSLTKKYINQIENEVGFSPAETRAEIEKSKYPTDSLTYLSKSVVEFVTPANKTGLGTEGAAKIANAPIQGVVVLYECQETPTGMSILRTSLGAKNQRWVNVLMTLNISRMNSESGCLE